MKNFQPNKTEQKHFIVLGIFTFYILVEFFIFYLYLFHKYSIVTFSLLSFIFLMLYFPRFLLLKKINISSHIKVDEEYLYLQDDKILLSDIIDFKVDKEKSKVIFFINNQMVIYNEATFHLRFQKTQKEFLVVGSEKIKLLKEFLESITKR